MSKILNMCVDIGSLEADNTKILLQVPGSVRKSYMLTISLGCATTSNQQE